jgi:arsenite methyltransferase
MALTCPSDFDKGFLQEKVRETYEQVAKEPDGNFHFHRGPEYASQYLGYDYEELMQLPFLSTERFAGVGNPVQIGDNDTSLGAICAGQVVLDHACGAGMDLLLAARRVGKTGKAIGVDMTAGMRKAAKEAAEEAGMQDIVDIREGVYENLPVDDASVDVVISNGVINLAPDKLQVFKEISRVLKPGGHLFMADVVVQRELTEDARSNPVLWAACVGGALVESELTGIAEATGFTNSHVVKRFNCFYNTTAEEKVAKDLFVHAVNFVATKPEVN